MKFKKFKLTASLILVVFATILAGCSASNYPQNDQGVYQAQPSTLGKDAVRVKGKILTTAKKVGDRLSYEVEVIEILNQGATFATVEPNIAERVTLYTTATTKFKKNSEVVFDASSPISREAGQLVLNMIVE